MEQEEKLWGKYKSEPHRATVHEFSAEAGGCVDNRGRPRWRWSQVSDKNKKLVDKNGTHSDTFSGTIWLFLTIKLDNKAEPQAHFALFWGEWR